MAGLLSGLSGLGLDNLENIDVFEDPEKVKKEQEEAKKPPAIDEKDVIYDKSFDCPVCDKKFSAKIMKTGKVRLLNTDKDLRPVYDGVDMQKYDVLLCPHCGYAAIARFFAQITPTQAKLIQDNISKKVKLHEYQDEIYSYEQAVERHKLALANAVVKRAKTSEKAYICLKSAWLYRGYWQDLEKHPESSKELIEEIKSQEEVHLQSAYKGFIEARQAEGFPMCGMDELTVDYLIAVLGVRFKEYEVAGKMVASILVAPSANNRIKDKARDLKEEILMELKKNKK